MNTNAAARNGDAALVYRGVDSSGSPVLVSALLYPRGLLLHRTTSQWEPIGVTIEKGVT